MSDEAARFRGRVLSRATRKLRAQLRGAPPVSMGLGMFGVIGWSVAAPTLLGALLGAWIDKNHTGSHSWTLALLVAGLILGCASAGYWVSAQTTLLDRESSGPRVGGPQENGPE